MSGFLGGLFGTEHKKDLPPPPLPKRNKSYETRRNSVLSRQARVKNANRLRKHRETMQTQLGDIDDYSNTGVGAFTTKKRRSLTDDMREDLSREPFEFMGGKTRKRRRKRRRKTKRKGRRKTKKKRKIRKRKTRRKR